MHKILYCLSDSAGVMSWTHDRMQTKLLLPSSKRWDDLFTKEHSLTPTHSVGGEYTTVYKGTLEYTTVYNSIQQYTRVH